MGTVAFSRPRRAVGPAVPDGDLPLNDPPLIPEPVAGKPFGNVLRMLPMVAGMGAMMLMMTQRGGGGMLGGGPLGSVVMGLYGVSMLGMMLTQTGRDNDDQAQQLDLARREYFRYLGETRRTVRAAADEQRRAVLWNHPEPSTLWTVAGSRRMWERRSNHVDFGVVRVGVGPQRFAQKLVPPGNLDEDNVEPLTVGAVRRFMRTHDVVPSVPLSLDLGAFSVVQYVGDAAAARSLAMAMLAQLVAWHTPDDLRVMVCVAPEREAQWAWAKWLPHLQHPERVDGAGEARLFATSLLDVSRNADVARVVGAPRRLVVVADGIDGVLPDGLASADTKVTVLDLSGLAEPPRRIDPGTGVLEINRGTLTLHYRQGSGQIAHSRLGRPDAVEPVYAEMLARALAPFRMAQVADDEDADRPFEPPQDYPSLLGVPDPLRIDLGSAWRLRPMADRLRIPFGSGERGQPVFLDIKEAALGGMGPHGLCIGATGSGKSEFLRTLCLGLAMTHSPEFLNFVLVDFKGGATFLGLDSLPHTSAVITNLEGELTLVDRMQDAIAGEMERRMEVLRAAGNYKNREDYEEARVGGVDMAPMPSLFIVVDEFSELLAARPEFIELFIQIGRIGRSIGVHLLLASQRLEEGKLRGLDTFLSYRIALRTFSAAESRTVIGVPDAYELPTPPGNGYLKFDTVSMVRFKAAYVSGPWHASAADGRAENAAAAPDERAWVPPVAAFETGWVRPELPPEPDVPLPASLDEVPVAPARRVADDDDEETLLSIVVGQLQGHGWPAHQVWLPPLEEPPTLDQLLPGPLAPLDGRGLTTPDARAHGRLVAPIALVDKPRQQRRDPLWLDLAGAGGHVAVAGGPQSGKSTALRTIIAALSLTNTPAEAGFYVLDFGGGSLMSMRSLPHVGSVTTRLDVDRVRRTVAELTALMRERERLFAELGIDSVATFRRGRRDGSIPADRFPTDVFLVVDGWLTLRQEFEALEQSVTTLAARGLGYGMHVMAAATKWSEFRPAIRDLIGSRIELKLGDPYESEIDRKRAAQVPAGRPGRGISPDGLHLLVGLPRVDGVGDPDSVTDGQRGLIEAVGRAWPGPGAAEVRMLPEDFPYTDLPQPLWNGRDRSFPIGIDENELAPVMFDPVVDSHFMIFGGPESGKSSLLRAFLHGIVTRYTPAEARIFLLDYRRSLLGFVETEHLLRYAPSSATGPRVCEEVAAAARKRLPGADVTQQQLRDRTWWQGMELFVVVDDYELVGGSMNHALAPFTDLISQSRDIGLHIILARGMGGAGRAAYGDPVIGKAKESVQPGLIMSGTRDEGAILGDVKPQQLPPGRGTLVTRAGTMLIQTANFPAPEQ